MLLPTNFKDTIADIFYDKDINILSKTETLDAEGGRKKAGGTVASIFSGNVNYSSLKEIQEEYGLDYKIDIAITTNNDVVTVDDMISYQDVIYIVTDVIPFDSHVLVVAVKNG